MGDLKRGMEEREKRGRGRGNGGEGLEEEKKLQWARAEKKSNEICGEGGPEINPYYIAKMRNVVAVGASFQETNVISTPLYS